MKRFTTLLLLAAALLLSALPALADASTHNAGLPALLAATVGQAEADRILAQPDGAAKAARLLIALGATTIQQGTTPIARPAKAAPVEHELGSEENPYTKDDFLGKTFEELGDLNALRGKFFAGDDDVARVITGTEVVPRGTSHVTSVIHMNGQLYFHI